MSHPWFEHYPDGVPHTIELGSYTSLVSLIDEGFVDREQGNVGR